MKSNSQTLWIMMIISGYAKKMEMSIAEAVELLLRTDCIKYLDECYNVLHLLSNEDVVEELVEMSGAAK